MPVPSVGLPCLPAMPPALISKTFRLLYILNALAVICLLWQVYGTWREAHEPNRLIVPLQVEKPGNAQLFFDQGQGIREEDSIAVTIVPRRKLAEVAFVVPRTPLHALRLHPVADTGRFAISAPRLETATGRTLVQFSTTSVVANEGIADWQQVADHWEGRGLGDPQVGLLFQAPLPAGKLHWPWESALVVGLLAAVLLWWHRRHPACGPKWPSPGTCWATIRNRASWLTDDGARQRIALGLGVLAVQLWLLWPLHQTLDWPMWDEANYAAQGSSWAQEGIQTIPLHTAPLYVASYALWSHAGDLAAAIFTQHYVTKLLTTLLLYTILAFWWRRPLAAACVALAWATTLFQIEFPVLLYQSAWGWFMAALVVVDAWPLAGLFLAGLATGTRQEYQFAVVILAAWLIWRGWRQRWTWRHWLAADGRITFGAAACTLTTALLLGGLIAHTHLEQSANRAWFAFQQHYAVRAVASGEVTGLNPWLDFDQIMQRDFPGARTLGEAWQCNAPAMIRHVTYNLRQASVELWQLWQFHAGLALAGALLLGGAALALLSRPPTARPHRSRASSMVLAASSLVVISPGLLIMAKGCYLLPIFAGVIGGLGGLLLLTRRSWKWAGIAGVAVLASGMVLVALAPAPFVAGSRPRPVHDTVERLRELFPHDQPFTLLSSGASSFAHYLGDARCRSIEAIPGAEGKTGPTPTLREWLDRVQPDAILVSDYWRQSSAYDAGAFDRELPETSWTRYDTAGSPLYVRKP